jgi:tetratricopeptide (TPR) repeat protein
MVALADQEQVEAAVRRSRTWEEQGGLAGPLVALALLASEQPSEAVAAAKAFLDAHGDSRDPALRSLAALSWYVVGRAAGEAGDELRRVDPALEQARTTLISTGDPLDLLLAQRALASAALWGDPARAAERREAVQADSPVDPAAGVLLALSLDRAGQVPAARSALEKAARGADHPWVQFQHGLFYYQSDRDMARARQIWRTFLAGRPTGRRAEKAAEALR